MGAVTLNRTGKLVLTVALFVVAVVLVFVASAVNTTAPLFVAWLPLLAVPWVLTRPERRAELEPNGVRRAGQAASEAPAETADTSASGDAEPEP